MIGEKLHNKPYDVDSAYKITKMLTEIYMEGVNMTGEYQGCWVRFKDIERIVNKYIIDICGGIKNERK